MCRNSPTAVGIDIQLTIIDGALSAGSQPRPTPAANVQAREHHDEHGDAGGDGLGDPRRAAEPVSCAAQTSTRNGSATPALALTAIASGDERDAARRCWPRSATSAPAASSPTTSRSLCPPPIMWMTIIGLATATHSASGTRPPRRRVSSGSAQTSSASPGSSASRISTTPRMMLSPTSRGDGLGDQDEQRAVRRRGVLPEVVHVVGEDPGHRLGADRVRVEPGQRQRALGEVAEDVAGEQRRREQHRRRSTPARWSAPPGRRPGRASTSRPSWIHAHAISPTPP